MSDPAGSYRRLRDETASMLGLGSDELSMIENLQVDSLALLRLAISDLQGAALAGQDIDLDRLSDALGMLSKLLPEAALQARPVVAPPSDGDGGDTMEEFERLLTNIREAKAFEEASALDKARAEIAQLKAEIERLRGPAVVETEPRAAEPDRPPGPPWGVPPSSPHKPSRSEPWFPHAGRIG